MCLSNASGSLTLTEIFRGIYSEKALVNGIGHSGAIATVGLE